jgi:1-acyl-sn-glycerol-3-phosphate acyltransferase
VSDAASHPPPAHAPGMRRWFYRPGCWLTRFGMFFLGPLRVTGLEHVPREGAFVLVANHLSLLDPLIVGATAGEMAGRLVHFMAKEELRSWPLIGWLANEAGVFFVRRGEGDRTAQRISLELLALGEPLGMFPEGTRSRNGQLRDGRAGAALLAIRADVPLLPVGIVGSGNLFPKGTWFPHRSRVTVRIGPAFSLPAQPHGRIDRQLLAQGTDRIMHEIAALLPESQRGRYRHADDSARAAT